MNGPRKPTHLKEVAGAYVKNPSRRNNHEPIPHEPIGPAVEVRSTEYSAVWDEIVSIIPPGVLGCSDRVWLEITVGLLIRYRKEPEGFSAADLRNLTTALVKLGLNPVDRQRLAVIPEDRRAPEDEYFSD